MRRSDAFAAAGLSLAAFAAYLRGAWPSLAARDAGDLALAAYRLGVAHPPGYPLYALLGHAWLLLLPLATPGYALNVLSALAGAASVGVLYLWCRRRGDPWVAAGCAAAFGAAALESKFAGLGEKYTLHVLFVSGLLLASEGQARTFHKRACLAGLLFGLGWVNHQSLILLLPGLGLIWLWQAKAHGLELGGAAKRFSVWAAAGAALSLFVWVRLGSLSRAWAVWTRADYGTFSLFSGFARPLTPDLADGLIGYFLKTCASASWGLAAALALFAVLAALVRRRGGPETGLLAGWLLFGPFFFLMTRFDVSGWVARSVLEPAFLVPILLTAALAACALSRLPPRAAKAGALLLAGLSLTAARPAARDDFSAYDYRRDLRRALPPGSSAVLGGDTAIFGLRLRQARGLLPGRRWESDLDDGAGPWLASRASRQPALVSGLSRQTLSGLGIDARRLTPCGLVQRLDGPCLGGWDFSLLRGSPDASDSYARDARLSYAFAHYLDAELEKDPARSVWQQKWSAILDPEDFRPRVQ